MKKVRKNILYMQEIRKRKSITFIFVFGMVLVCDYATENHSPEWIYI